MATVTGATADRVQALEDAGIKSAGINANGHLILTRNDDSTVDAGSFQAPTGVVNMFGGGTVPAGWLLCNGAAISRTTYAALFAVIGTAYGAGDGTTTFNLPNMEARFPRMQAAARGGTGGADTHVHVMGAHAHDLSGGSPTGHAQVNFQTGSGPNFQAKRVDVATYSSVIDGNMSSVALNSGSPTRGVTLAGFTSNGGGATNTASANNDPPYVNLNFIIKA